VKFRFMEAEKASYPVTLMCRVLAEKRSSFYAWRERPASTRRLRDDALVVHIREVHRTNKSCYGSPRVHRALQEEGQRVSRKRVARLMRREGLKGKKTRRFVRTTVSLPHEPAAPNLLNRNFQAPAPNRAWTTDVTALWTLQGWLYLAVIMDLYSRRIVGWAMRTSPSTELCIAALQHAIDQRQPPTALDHHSDRGVQYTSHAYQALLRAHGMQASMSRRGNCWDNAVTESFFGSMKVELDITNHAGFKTYEQGRSTVFEYIEGFYNRRRLHSTLGYVSPARYEESPPRVA
jgi:putative transposase